MLPYIFEIKYHDMHWHQHQMSVKADAPFAKTFGPVGTEYIEYDHPVGNIKDLLRNFFAVAPRKNFGFACRRPYSITAINLTGQHDPKNDDNIPMRMVPVVIKFGDTGWKIRQTSAIIDLGNDLSSIMNAVGATDSLKFGVQTADVATIDSLWNLLEPVYEAQLDRIVDEINKYI